MSEAALAHIDGPAPEALDQLITIGDIPELGAARCGEREALIWAETGIRITYAELDRASSAFAALLAGRGIGPGARIAYLGRNSDLFFAVLFGAIRSGAVLVPLNWRLAVPELAYPLQDSESRLLILDEDFLDAGRAATAGRDIELLKTEGDAGLRELLTRPATALRAPREPAQVILQLYTSGTTGKPKGVLVTHGGVSAARHAERFWPQFARLDEGLRSLSAMPNFHVGGMSWVLIGLLRFGTVVITADPSPGNILRRLREFGCEHSFIVPTVIRAIVDTLLASGENAPPMQSIHYGAMPMDLKLLEEALALFDCPFVQHFGMTENTGSATLLGPSDHDPARPHLLKSVGKPYPGMSLEIRGPDRQVLKRGEHGEIWIKSPTRMAGYWKLPAKTAEVLIDGWYASGDGGYLDAEGFLYLTDRIKDMIVTGGENVYPIEVEEALRLHPAVLDAAVIGLPDAQWGEAIVAVIELRPGPAAEAEELRTHIRGRVATYKCPKRFHFAALPRTASGKVQRAKLRQDLA